MDAVALRRRAARSDMPWAEAHTARLWRAMQARQLLRISLEGLLNWVLAKASGAPASLDALVDDLLVGLAPQDGLTLGEWLEEPCPCEDGLDGVVSPVSLLDEINGVDQYESVALCASGLRAAVRICRSMGEGEDLFGGQPDRLPLKRVSERLRSSAGLGMRDACELIVSEMLIGQHVYWAIGRSGDDTQRLRIVLDEGGWIALHGAGHANPTPDRLGTLLELAADCGLVDRSQGGYFRADGVAPLPGETP